MSDETNDTPKKLSHAKRLQRKVARLASENEQMRADLGELLIDETEEGPEHQVNPGLTRAQRRTQSYHLTKAANAGLLAALQAERVKRQELTAELEIERAKIAKLEDQLLWLEENFGLSRLLSRPPINGKHLNGVAR